MSKVLNGGSNSFDIHFTIIRLQKYIKELTIIIDTFKTNIHYIIYNKIGYNVFYNNVKKDPRFINMYIEILTIVSNYLIKIEIIIYKLSINKIHNITEILSQLQLPYIIYESSTDNIKTYISKVIDYVNIEIDIIYSILDTIFKEQSITTPTIEATELNHLTLTPSFEATEQNEPTTTSHIEATVLNPHTSTLMIESTELNPPTTLKITPTELQYTIHIWPELFSDMLEINLSKLYQIKSNYYLKLKFMEPIITL